MESFCVGAFGLEYIEQQAIQAVDNFGDTEAAKVSGKPVPLGDRPLERRRTNRTVETMKRRSQLREDVQG
jgi:hypothetical protein